MPSTHHDLSMTSYGLIALLVVGHELVGLQTTLLLGLALAGLLIAVSLVAAFLSHRPPRERRRPPI